MKRALIVFVVALFAVYPPPVLASEALGVCVVGYRHDPASFTLNDQLKDITGEKAYLPCLNSDGYPHTFIIKVNPGDGLDVQLFKDGAAVDISAQAAQATVYYLEDEAGSPVTHGYYPLIGVALEPGCAYELSAPPYCVSFQTLSDTSAFEAKYSEALGAYSAAQSSGKPAADLLLAIERAKGLLEKDESGLCPAQKLLNAELKTECDNLDSALHGLPAGDPRDDSKLLKAIADAKSALSSADGFIYAQACIDALTQSLSQAEQTAASLSSAQSDIDAAADSLNLAILELNASRRSDALPIISEGDALSVTGLAIAGRRQYPKQISPGVDQLKTLGDSKTYVETVNADGGGHTLALITNKPLATDSAAFITLERTRGDGRYENMDISKYVDFSQELVTESGEYVTSVRLPELSPGCVYSLDIKKGVRAMDGTTGVVVSDASTGRQYAVASDDGSFSYPTDKAQYNMEAQRSMLGRKALFQTYSDPTSFDEAMADAKSGVAKLRSAYTLEYSDLKAYEQAASAYDEFNEIKDGHRAVEYLTQAEVDKIVSSLRGFAEKCSLAAFPDEISQEFPTAMDFAEGGEPFVLSEELPDIDALPDLDVPAVPTARPEDYESYDALGGAYAQAGGQALYKARTPSEVPGQELYAQNGDPGIPSVYILACISFFCLGIALALGLCLFVVYRRKLANKPAKRLNPPV